MPFESRKVLALLYKSFESRTMVRMMPYAVRPKASGVRYRQLKCAVRRTGRHGGLAFRQPASIGACANNVQHILTVMCQFWYIHLDLHSSGPHISAADQNWRFLTVFGTRDLKPTWLRLIGSLPGMLALWEYRYARPPPSSCVGFTQKLMAKGPDAP